VRFVVNRHQVGERDLRVALGGGEASVPEQFLDGAQVGAVGQQVGGVGVAKAVGMKRRVTREMRDVELDDGTRSAGAEAPAAMIDEQGALGGSRGAGRKVSLERRGGLGAVWDLALFAAFAAYADPGFGAVEASRSRKGIRR
jgi:hypothetical protein